MQAFKKTDIAHGISANRAWLPDRCTLVYVNVDGTKNWSRVYVGSARRTARAQMAAAYARINGRIRAAKTVSEAEAAASTIEAQPGRPVGPVGGRLTYANYGFYAEQSAWIEKAAAGAGMSKNEYLRMLVDEDRLLKGDQK